MAVACGVRTSLTSVLNSSIMASLPSPPYSLARDICREPRWSMAAAAMMPRSLETFLRPASLPAVSFMRILLNADEYECLEVPNIVNQGGGKAGLPQARQPSFRFSHHVPGGILSHC